MGSRDDFLKLINKNRILKNIQELEEEISRLKNVLNGNLDSVALTVVYHNRDMSRGQYYPEDDYDIDYTFPYTDNWKNMLVAVDEILRITSNNGYFQEFEVSIGDTIIFTIEKKKEFNKLLQTDNREEIVSLIRKIYNIRKKISEIKNKIDYHKNSLKSQQMLKEKYQNKEKIAKIEEELQELNKNLESLKKEEVETNSRLKLEFGVNIDEIRENIFDFDHVWD